MSASRRANLEEEVEIQEIQEISFSNEDNAAGNNTQNGESGPDEGPYLKEEPDEDEEYKEAVLAQAKYLGIDPIEDADLLWIARESLEADLPPGWEVVENDAEDGDEDDENAGIPFYYCEEKDLSTWEHPLDESYREKYIQEKNKKETQKAIQGAQHVQEESEQEQEKDIDEELSVDTQNENEKSVEGGSEQHSHAGKFSSSNSNASSSPSSYTDSKPPNDSILYKLDAHEEESLYSIPSDGHPEDEDQEQGQKQEHFHGVNQGMESNVMLHEETKQSQVMEEEKKEKRKVAGSSNSTYSSSNYSKKASIIEERKSAFNENNQMEQEGKIQELEQRCKQTELQLETIEKDNKDLLDSLDEIETDLQMKVNANENLSKSIQELTQEMRAYESKVVALEREKREKKEGEEEQRKKVRFLEDEIKKLRSSNSSLYSEKEKAIEIEKEKKQVESVQKREDLDRLERVESDLYQAKGRLDGMEETKRTLESEVAEAKNQIKVQEEGRRKVEADSIVLRTKLKDLEKEGQTLQADNQMYLVEIEDYQSQLSILTEANIRLEGEKRALQESMTKMEEENVFLKEERSKFEEEQEERKEAEEKLRTDLTLAENKISQLQGVIDEMKEEAKVHSTKTESTEISREQLEAKLTNIGAEKQELETRNESLRESMERVQQENESLKIQGQEICLQKEELLREKNQIMQAKEEMVLQQEAKENRIQTLITTMNEANANVADREIRFRELERKVLTLENANEKFRHEKSALVDAKVNAEEEKLRMEKDCENRIVDYIRQKQEMEERNRILQGHLQEVQDENSTLALKVTSTEKVLKEEIQKEKDLKNQISKKIEQKEILYEKTKEQTEAEVSELRIELESMVEKYNSAMLDTKKLEHQVAKSAKDVRYLSLEHELSESKLNYENLQQEFTQKVEEHSSELKTVKEDIKKNIPLIAANTVQQVEKEWMEKLDEESIMFKSMMLKEREHFESELQASYQKINAHKLELHHLFTKKKVNEEEMKRTVLKLKSENQKLLMALQETEDSRVNLVRQRDQMFAFQEAAQSSVMSILQGHVSLLQSNLHSTPAMMSTPYSTNMSVDRMPSTLALSAPGLGIGASRDFSYDDEPRRARGEEENTTTTFTRNKMNSSANGSESRNISELHSANPFDNYEISINTAALVEYSSHEEEEYARIIGKGNDDNSFTNQHHQDPNDNGRDQGNDRILLAEDLIDDYDINENGNENNRRNKNLHHLNELNLSSVPSSSLRYSKNNGASSYRYSDYPQNTSNPEYHLHHTNYTLQKEAPDFYGSRSKGGYTGYYDGYWRAKYFSK